MGDAVAKRSGSSKVIVAVTGVVAAATLMTAVLGLMSRERFGTFAFWSHPERISYCGRDYDRGGSFDSTKEKILTQIDGGPTWRTVAHTLTDRAIEAPIQPAGSRFSVCTMVLYIRSSPTTWVSYCLVGGP